MSDPVSDIQVVAHGRKLIKVYRINKIDVVVIYLAEVVEGIGVDEITEGKNKREGRNREQLISDRN